MDPLRSVVIPVLSRLYCHLHPVVIVVIRAAGGYDALLKVVTDAIAAKTVTRLSNHRLPFKHDQPFTGSVMDAVPFRIQGGGVGVSGCS